MSDRIAETIFYNKLPSLLRDLKSNVVMVNGKIAVGIEPFTIRIESIGSYGEYALCADVVCDGVTTEIVAESAIKVINTNQFQITARAYAVTDEFDTPTGEWRYEIILRANLRNLINHDYSAIKTIQLYAGTTNPDGVDIDVSSYWGSLSAEAQLDGVCACSDKKLLGTVTLNMAKRTLMLDTTQNTTTTDPCETKDNRKEIVIFAPYQWCSEFQTSVYTETISEDTLVDSYVWNAEQKTIIVQWNDDESEAEETEKALDRASSGIISAYQNNRYINITLEGISHTLWRSYVDDHVSYQEIFDNKQYTYLTLQRYTIAGRDADAYGDHLLFIEPDNIMVGGNTGMVFSAASDTIEASAERLETWDSDKYLVAENLPLISASDIPETEAVNYTLVKHYSDITSGVGYGYIKKTGNTKTLTYIPPASGGVSTTESFSEYTTWDEKYTFWQSDTTSVIYPSEPYVDSSEIYWDYIKPDNIDPATGEVAIQISRINNDLRFTYGGRWYGYGDGNGYLFVVPKISGWRTAPCVIPPVVRYMNSQDDATYYVSIENAISQTAGMNIDAGGYTPYAITVGTQVFYRVEVDIEDEEFE